MWEAHSRAAILFQSAVLTLAIAARNAPPTLRPKPNLVYPIDYLGLNHFVSGQTVFYR